MHTLTYNLRYGGNLLSIPLNLEDSSPEAIFGTEGTVYEIVGEGVGAILFNGQWLGSLNQLDPLQGYWVMSNSSYTLTVTGTSIGNPTYDLHQGSNLISYPGSEELDINLALEGYDNIDEIIGDGVATTTLPNGQWVGSLSEFIPGEAYWFVNSTGFEFQFQNLPEFEEEEEESDLIVIPEIDIIPIPDDENLEMEMCISIMGAINDKSKKRVSSRVIPDVCRKMFGIGFSPRLLSTQILKSIDVNIASVGNQ